MTAERMSKQKHYTTASTLPSNMTGDGRVGKVVCMNSITLVMGYSGSRCLLHELNKISHGLFRE